jgi:hypothetical protein
MAEYTYCNAETQLFVMGRSPVKELTETKHDKLENSGRSLRSHLAFLEQRELRSEKNILRDQRVIGAKEQAEEGQQLPYSTKTCMAD